VARKRKPFAALKKQIKGWYAVSRVGMSSGPWDTEEEAQKVVDKWNDATSLD
jgi:hypothetical protein